MTLISYIYIAMFSNILYSIQESTLLVSIRACCSFFSATQNKACLVYSNLNQYIFTHTFVFSIKFLHKLLYFNLYLASW